MNSKGSRMSRGWQVAVALGVAVLMTVAIAFLAPDIPVFAGIPGTLFVAFVAYVAYQRNIQKSKK